jgi:DNA-directed RNA polymerase II subunit RPB2
MTSTIKIKKTIVSKHKSNEAINFKEDTWNVADALFAIKNPLTRNQIVSYNHFVENKIPQIVCGKETMYGNWNDTEQKYMIEYSVEFDNILISEPTIRESGNNISLMTPKLARDRNLTYASAIYADVRSSYVEHSSSEHSGKINTINTINKLKIGVIPIMLQSKYCVLSQQQAYTKQQMGECKYDQGGYFIINGGERVIVSMERKTENKSFVFNQSKTASKYAFIAEINSISLLNPDNIKKIEVKMLSKDDNFGRTIKVSFPRIKKEIPLFVLFRALGVISDKEILEHVVYNVELEEVQEFLNLLNPSLEEALIINDNHLALEYLSKQISHYQSKRVLSEEDKLKYTYKVLEEEFLPHCGKSFSKKAYFLGHMVNNLLSCKTGRREYDDRDSFLNKRVNSPGVLLADLMRLGWKKVIKDMKTNIERDLKKSISVREISNTLQRKIKSSTIDLHMKHALSTGTWGMHSPSAKKGISQVITRLSYASSLSHLRRVISPVQRDGKQTEPRKLHSTQWMTIDPSETPEGGSVGIVKNIAITALITIDVSPEPVLQHLDEYNMIKLENANTHDISHFCKIIVNGDWIGIHNNPYWLSTELRKQRRKNILNIYISISWNIELNEMVIYTDGGRLTRPIYIITNNELILTKTHINKLKSGEITWYNLLYGDDEAGNPAVIEYLDKHEENTCMIAMNHTDIVENSKDNEYYYNYTHLEIHPSMMFGVLVSAIPFSDRNQAPRNIYQGAMGKQAMGVYCSNYQQRMDTIGHVLYYPQKSIISTRASKYVASNELPSGMNVIVAIACYTGFNQEDSLIMNQSSIDRGLFISSFYRRYLGEVKKNQNVLEEETFCKPEKFHPNGKIKTSGIKAGSYDKLDENGFVKVGEYVTDGDIIIGKTIPLKNMEEDRPQFKDASTTIRGNESGIADWVYSNKNGDGYKFCKVRVRAERKPVIGDKFSSRHGRI